MRKTKLLVSVLLGGVGVAAMAIPAGAAPTNAKNSLTFVDTVCTNLNPPNVTRVLDFTVNGNGRGPAHTDAGIFQPLSLLVTDDGQVDVNMSFVKNNVDQGQWSCNGQATVDFPGGPGPVVIAFTAVGNFKP